MTPPYRRRTLRVLIALILLATLIFAAPEPAAAHPLGNFSVNRYSRLELESGRIQIFYVVDMAEIPTFQERPNIDENGDGELSVAERDDYLARQAAALRDGLELLVNGTPLGLEPQDQRLLFTPGAGDLPTMRIEVTFVGNLPQGTEAAQASYEDRNYHDRLGWQEIVVRATDSATLLSSSVPSEDISQALQSYPQDLLQAPPSVSSAAFRFETTATVASGTVDVPDAITSLLPATSQSQFGSEAVAGLVAVPNLGPGVLLTAALAAFVLGAAHALTPGHGKTIVGAYLVGSRGTAWHALFLGLTTTVTHTLGVFLLGLLVLFASQFVLPESLYPWLGVLSGLLVVTIGASLLRNRWRARNSHHHHHDHDHHHHEHGHDHDQHSDHSHGHDHHHHLPSGDASLRSLLALGISGGLLPCPSALVLLLSAVALQRVALGLFLIVIFSLGLASVLTAVGLVLVYAGRLFQRLPAGNGRLLAALPIASALFITVAGLVITLTALQQAAVL